MWSQCGIIDTVRGVWVAASVGWLRPVKPWFGRTGAAFGRKMREMRTIPILALAACVAGALLSLAACDAAPDVPQSVKSAVNAFGGNGVDPAVNKDWKNPALNFGLRLSAAAEERATHSVTYDAAYVQIPYPNGDVAPGKGVCADEVVRVYRLLGIDLQRLVHEDMRKALMSTRRVGV